MHDALAPGVGRSNQPDDHGSSAGLEHCIEHAAHLLPSQGPITVFVHHNTLHAFEDLPFDAAVKKGAEIYGRHPYLPEDFYRAEFARGRIRGDDLAAALLDDLGDEADRLIGFMGTRYHLRLAMLDRPLRIGSDAELRWLVAETDALRRFRDEAPPDVRRRLIEGARQWAGRLKSGVAVDVDPTHRERDGLASLLSRFNAASMESWTPETWESFTLHALWRICRGGVHGLARSVQHPSQSARHRDLLLAATGRDADLPVHEVLIRFCAAFLDQGFAGWTLPNRDLGFFRAFADLFRDAKPVKPWLHELPAEIQRIEQAGLTPIESIDESLHLMGVAEAEREEFVTQTLLALRGWAGMLRQMETNAEWTAHPAPAGTLIEYLAVRLILERLALGCLTRETPYENEVLGDLRAALRRRMPHPPRVSVDQRAYLVFQLAQLRGWGPADLHRMSKADWARLVEEIESFGSVERRRIYHLAYERAYRDQTLDALAAHPPAGEAARSVFQAVCCLDEREESFRRHLEEVEPACETFGVAGFFGVAMYYRGVAEAQYRPLCPINIKPNHYVQEEPLRSLEEAGRLQAEARRGLGRIVRRLHVGTRSFIGGALTGMVGSVASLPLLLRVLLPRQAAMVRRLLDQVVTPPLTRLRLDRTASEPGPDDDSLGYSRAEMAGVVGGTLRAIGLTEGFAPLIVVVGHGSSSLNNPQKAAYDCGACGGANGGPNARAFARMANDPRVRRLLEESGLTIPEGVHFVGARHNTCTDGMTYFDLDDLPPSHRSAFKQAREALDEARRRNAHERCRRFESAPLDLTPAEALRHVEVRAEDLSQTRPECGHATNAVCIVGRRSRTRGLFLDRRSFLTSYDPTRDDETGATLGGLLRAVVPVCAGINLEYFFSYVDPTGYGCGTKLPHNITSLLGVMDGAASDLRPGLPWQMVEIHEAMRILFVVETTPEILMEVMNREEALGRLARNSWVQLATLDPSSSRIHVYQDGRFQLYEPKTGDLPVVPSSLDWYQGRRNHLGFATIAGGPR
ncbi:DUF2309 domain-containing protein [Paludisphaera rhizosphaerae]|uniref:DUF2309 domain-containing protein n=1 Tax=Paludisphaera rhizosphaerae TaxID=2711216 RepID=UPI0013ECEE3C|nr:DUF2309 domain-containing protein [Paludisphaera rhizosphaerae]